MVFLKAATVSLCLRHFLCPHSAFNFSDKEVNVAQKTIVYQQNIVSQLMLHKRRHSCRFTISCNGKKCLRKKLCSMTIKSYVTHTHTHTHTHTKIHVDLKYFVSHRKEMHAKKTVLIKKVFCCTKKTLLLHKNWNQCLRKSLIFVRMARHRGMFLLRAILKFLWRNIFCNNLLQITESKNTKHLMSITI